MAQQRLSAAGSHSAVKHELLVRYLDAWTPSVLHSGRRVTYAEGYAGAGVEADRPDGSPGAALRVFAEFSDRLAGHKLAMVLVEDNPRTLAALQAGLAAAGAPDGLTIHAVAGSCADDLVPALGQVGAFDGPLLTHLDAAGAIPPPYEVVAAVSKHRSSELLLTLDGALLLRLCAGEEPPETGDRLFGDRAWRAVADQPADKRYASLVTCYRDAFRRAGLSAVVHVELVDRSGDAVQLLLFGTRSEKNLEKFKTELWAVDEYAGVRYRDPRDDEHELLNISDSPSLGPLRRALAAAVRADGSHTVADLRQHTLAETMYRAGEATRAVGVLVAGGVLAREPEKGRLAADTLLRSA